MPTDKQFTGQTLDDTGLYYYNARYYDPTIGRFISADSIVPDPTNPQELNRYAYCLNNPLKNIDPSGHNTVAIGGWVLAGLGFAVLIPVFFIESVDGFAICVSGAVGAGFELLIPETADFNPAPGFADVPFPALVAQFTAGTVAARSGRAAGLTVGAATPDFPY